MKNLEVIGFQDFMEGGELKGLEEPSLQSFLSASCCHGFPILVDEVFLPSYKRTSQNPSTQ